MTLYSHFPSRESLLEAALEGSVAQAVQALEDGAVETEAADEALARLIRSSWRVLDRHSSLFAAISTALTPDQVREHHERILDPVLRLVLRGQSERRIRTDLPAGWLVTVLYNLMHAAAGEVQAGRLASEAAPDVLVRTVLAALRPQSQVGAT